MKELLRRRVPQILGVYLAVGWGALEFTDWLVNRYVLSPHLTDFVLLSWAAMTPAVLLLAWFHGAPGRDRWTIVEKVGIPTNVLAAVLLLFVAFGDKDLGAATTAVTVENEAGETVERVVPKSEFRKHLALYYFENESGDTALDWLQYGLTWALAGDLLQDMFIESRTDFTDRFERAGIDDGLGVPLALKRQIAEDVHMEYFLTGSISGRPEDLTVETRLYETENGKLLETRTYSGDVLELVDKVSLQLKRDMEIPDHHIEEARDLPVKEIFTGSMAAFRSYVEGMRSLEIRRDWESGARHFAEAVQQDSAFAQAHLLRFLSQLYLNDVPKATESLTSAMELSYKLPERMQFGLRANYQRLVKQDPEKAIAAAGMWTELYPDDITGHYLLGLLYANDGRYDRAIAEYQKILQIDPGQYDYLRAVGALYEETGRFEQAAAYYQRYADEFPDDARSFTPLGRLSRWQGDHEAAQRYYERALLLDPENTGVMIGLAESAFDLGRFDDAVDQLDEALATSRTAGQRASVLDALKRYYERRGQLDKAIDYLHQRWIELGKDLPPVLVIQAMLPDLNLYAEAGMAQAAFDTIAAIAGRLTPPLDLISSIGSLSLAGELEDSLLIREAVDGVERLIAALGVEALRPAVTAAEAKVLELKGQCDQAIIGYRRAIELAPTRVDRYIDIGRCQRELGQLDEALESLDRILKIQPYDAGAHLETALVYLERGDRDRARQHLQTALEVWRDADPDFEPARAARDSLRALDARS
ncbi:MAG: tetratricopeptide repeat protein [Gemmatimonadales bacterium]